jgi:nucleoside-diphosphate-sugar epimerase
MGKTLIIGGNRFVGLRLSRLLDADAGCELHVLNRSGTAPGTSRAVLHKGSRDDLPATSLDRDWDAVVDFSCYDRAQALGAVRFFRNVGLYVHISTGSVYDAGRGLKESAFDPKSWPLRETPTEEEGKNPYQFGKRQAEAVFAQEAGFPTLLVRLPFIAGPDDYTRRFAFHVERVAKGLPMYFPNLEARSSFVDSGDAARFLSWCLDKGLTGPVNVASPQDIALKDLVAEVETRVGRKAVFAARESDGNHSPYGLDETRSMDVGKMRASGFESRPLHAWLPGLIDALKS